MVTSHPRPVIFQSAKEKVLQRGSFIYITGCDGTGKTTQSALMLQKLRRQGVEPRHLWLRFPFLTSIPLLAYARWRGYSHYEEIVSEVGKSVRHGYWDFEQSWLLRAFLPWFMVVDVLIAAIRKVYIPLWQGQTIVCERFALDTAIDLSIGLSEPEFIHKMPGKLFLQVIPDLDRIAVLDLSDQLARHRRHDLASDRRLAQRLSSYREMAEAAGLGMISTDQPIEDVFDAVVRQIEKPIL